jgi:hypothetical protein
VEAWCDAVEAQRRPRQRVPGVVVAGQRRARSYNDFFLFFCFVCRASQLRRMAKDVRHYLKGVPSVAFVCRAPTVAHDKDS